MGNTIDLKLQPEHFKLIVEGLHQGTYSIVAPILADINAQLQAQQDELKKQAGDGK